MAHLLIENTLNGLLFRWLRRDAPDWGSPESAKKAEDQLWRSITKMDFAKKYSLIEPYFSLRFPTRAANPWKINDLRNDIFHGRAIKEAKFDDKPLSEEQTVEDIFLVAQDTAMSLDKFEEQISIPHELADRWRIRLEELGEPLR